MDTIGEIRLHAGTYAPDGWVFCDGRALNIGDYSALYQLIGSTYGGDDQSYFNVPDLQGRAPIGAGQGSGLPNYTLGEKGGEEKVTLTISHMPAHNHYAPVTGILVSSEDGHKTTFAGNYLAVSGENNYSIVADSYMAATATIDVLTVDNAGLATPVANVQPYLTISYIICYSGVYPTT